jgi:hypothetical protein
MSNGRAFPEDCSSKKPTIKREISFFSPVHLVVARNPLSNPA